MLPKLITLSGFDGREWSIAGDGNVFADSGEPAADRLIIVVPVNEGRVALQFINNFFVTSRGRFANLSANSKAIDDSTSFSVIENGDGSVSFRASSGDVIGIGRGDRHPLILVDEESPSSRFGVQDRISIAEEMSEMESCCGVSRTEAAPRHPLIRSAGVRQLIPSASRVGISFWEKQQHARLVLFGITALLARVNGRHRSAIERLMALWNSTEVLSAEVMRGLEDADSLEPFTGTLLGFNVFTKHFYDPDTGGNFWPNTYPESAFTMFRKYYSKTLDLLPKRGHESDLKNDVFKARTLGYAIGLAAHYLGDLTQPMHAANFANCLEFLRLDDRRHAAFELFADTILVGLQPMTDDDVDPGRLMPDDLIVDTAREAKAIYRKEVAQWLPGKVLLISDVRLFNNSWTAEEALQPVTHAIQNGYRRLAQFFLMMINQQPA
jgi:hypothetical protein